MLLTYLQPRRMILKATSIPIPLIYTILILFRVVDSFVSDIQQRRQVPIRILPSISHLSSKLVMATMNDNEIEGPSHVENILFIECGMSNFIIVWKYGSLLIRIYFLLSFVLKFDCPSRLSLIPRHSASFSFSLSFQSKYLSFC